MSILVREYWILTFLQWAWQGYAHAQRQICSHINFIPASQLWRGAAGRLTCRQDIINVYVYSKANTANRDLGYHYVYILDVSVGSLHGFE